MQQTYRERLKQRCEQHHIGLTEVQLDRLTQYVELLLQWRRGVNLTGLRQADRIIDVLVGESLDFLQRQALPHAARVLDLGTGAGVPGVPLAICAPDLHLTLLDRSEKKVTFLRHIVPRLQLHNCRPCCDTAQALARHLPLQQRFDAVVARGVGRLSDLLPLAAPLLRPGGTLVLRKPRGTAELEEVTSSLVAATWTDIRTISVAPSPCPAWVLVVAWRGADQ